MKTTFLKCIFLPVLLLCSSMSYAAKEYWSDRNDGGIIASEVMRTLPHLNGYEEVDNPFPTGNTTKLSFSVDMKWTNFRRRAASSLFQRTAIIRVITVRYRFGYRESDSEQVEWFDSRYKTVSHYVYEAGDDPGHENRNYTYYTKDKSKTFSYSEVLDVSRLEYDKDYVLVVEYHARPTDVYDFEQNKPSEQDDVNLQDNEHYYKEQDLVIENVKTGQPLVIRKESAKSPHISFDEQYTKRDNIASSEQYLVYNHPDAEIAVRLDVAGFPAQIVQDSLVYQPVSALATSEDNARVMPDNLKMTLYPQPGVCHSITCEDGGDYGANKYQNVAYLGDRPEEAAYAKTISSNLNNYTSETQYCYIRFGGLVEHKKQGETGYENAFLMLNQDNKVKPDGTSAHTDPDYWHEWKLKFSFLTDKAGTAEANGKHFNIQNANGYYEKGYLESTLLTNKMWKTLGYEHPFSTNVSEAIFSNSSSSAFYPKSNVLTLYAVPQVFFKPLLQHELDTKELCVVPSNLALSKLTEGDIILLYGREMEFSGFSPSIYGAEYGWEISFDGVTWQDADAAVSSSDRIQQPSQLAFTVVMDSSKDLLLKTSVLSARQQVLFRQTCVLTSFSSAQRSELYSHKGEDGRWYIKITAPNHYTYKPVANVSLEVSAVDDSGRTEPQYVGETVCKGESFNAKQLVWEAKNYSKVPEYRIYENNNGNLTLVQDGSNVFELPQITSDKTYMLVAKFCRDSLCKEVKFTVNEPSQIEIEKITSSHGIFSLDAAARNLVIANINQDVTLSLGCSDMAQSSYFYRAAAAEAWQTVSDPANLLLEAAGSSYYIRKQDANSCFSDSIKVELFGPTPIVNNRIEFRAADYAGESIRFLDAGASIPDITSYSVYGGYGTPTEENRCSYIYKWIYRYEGGIWEQLKRYTDSGRSTASQTQLSLYSQSSFTVDRKMEIARVVISMLDENPATQYCDTSNVLTIVSEKLLNEDDIRVIRISNECSGSPVVIKIDGEFDETTYEYVWSVDDDNLVLALEASTTQARIEEPVSDFNVSIVRVNKNTGAKSNKVVVPVKVYEAKAWFTMLVNGIEYDLLANPDEEFPVKGGSLVQFVNKSSGTNILSSWSLELQNWVATDIEGSLSSVKSPYCYLYNQGQNKVRLKVITDAQDKNHKCSSTVIAENLVVAGQGSTRSMPDVSGFVDADAAESIVRAQSEEISVYPTVVDNSSRNVTVRSNYEVMDYQLYDETGVLVMSGRANGFTVLSIPQSGSALYILCVNGRTFKILNK